MLAPTDLILDLSLVNPSSSKPPDLSAPLENPSHSPLHFLSKPQHPCQCAWGLHFPLLALPVLSTVAAPVVGSPSAWQVIDTQ